MLYIRTSFVIAKCKAIPCGASKHGIFSDSDSTYSVSSKHVIFHEKYSDSCPSTEYRSIFRRRNIGDDISCHLFVVVTTRTRMEIKFEIIIFMAISLPTTLSCNLTMSLFVYKITLLNLKDLAKVD